MHQFYVSKLSSLVHLEDLTIRLCIIIFVRAYINLSFQQMGVFVVYGVVVGIVIVTTMVTLCTISEEPSKPTHEPIGTNLYFCKLQSLVLVFPSSSPTIDTSTPPPSP